jgi:hypothetical protein
VPVGYFFPISGELVIFWFLDFFCKISGRRAGYASESQSADAKLMAKMALVASAISALTAKAD